MPEGQLHVKSIYGVNTKQPIVEIELENYKVQVSAATARRIALLLLECAEAAEQDGALFNWGLGHGFGNERAAQMVVVLRKYREEQQDAEDKYYSEYTP